ncbi:hypothetical protein NQ315_006380 [Exocentrus adspersus]|uniref:Glutathione peroxidase n=1 Tax=Exocentrus adspersus TaxID=1586481 RepID=A0AAV8W1A0_9CUCU|nr:hypothetical protein NQ315_006380 [Exocentrus adspersus]
MPQRRSARNKKGAESAPEAVVDNAETVEPPKKKLRTTTAKKQSKPKEETAPNPVEVSETSDQDAESASSIHQFTARDLNGEEVSLEKYKGHVCLLVNVASRCGHTSSNYKELNELYELYAESKGLRILAFPCNQFAGQEPGDSKKISEFIKKKGVKFDVFEKVEVNGKKAHPLWKFMTEKIHGPKGPNINWNFTKFIADKEGKVVERFKPTVKPLQLVEHLEKYW